MKNLNCNAVSAVQITHHFVTQMVRGKRRLGCDGGGRGVLSCAFMQYVLVQWPMAWCDANGAHASIVPVSCGAAQLVRQCNARALSASCRLTDARVHGVWGCQHGGGASGPAIKRFSPH